MCGIAGIFHYGSGAPVDEALLALMTNSMGHRGPDGHGTWTSGCVGLGHRRLAIIDPAAGHQPMRSGCSDVWVSFNGEIYNHQELRPALERGGHSFSTQCDTEVILRTYEERGESFPEALSGMFGIALWDGREEKLLLARDRLGIKPLFYYDSGESLYFASELRALLRAHGIPRELDPVAVHHYLNYEYVPAPGTILKGVRKLEAGEALVAQRAAPVRRRRYWQLDYEPKLELSWPEAVEGFQECFSRAVDRRLMSDVPLGAFLSGGIDSSSIVAMMARRATGPIQTFSMGFEDSSYDESRHARLVSNHFGTEHHTEVMTASSLQHVGAVFDDLDEPLADFSTLPTRLLCGLARRNVTVCLSGDGGDELLAGYERHTASLLARSSIDLAPRQFLALWGRLAAAIPQRSTKKGFWNKAKRFLEGASRDPEGRQFRWQSFSTPGLRERLYGESLRAAEPLEPGHAPIAVLLASVVASHPLDRELALETGLYLQSDILPKVDMMSMSVSLEARVPFLDHELVEFVAQLPPAMKQRKGRGKALLRRAMDGVLPPEILERPKEGFGMPVKHWLRTELYEQARQAFESSQLGGMVRPEACLCLLDEHREARADHSHMLWALLTLEEWSRRNLSQRESA